MSFAPKPGCPMCSIVQTAQHAPPNSPRTPSFPAGSTQREVLWRDDNFTAYREKANPVSSKGHVIIAFNLHVPSIYTLSSSDVGLLVNIKNLATRLLSSLLPPSSPLSTPLTTSPPTNPSSSSLPLQKEPRFHIGFITPPFKDTKIPVTDHLHAHAYIEPADHLGWWRGIAFSSVAWYDINDLIAEIRESVSNNRVKSGYENRRIAPIDLVPDAGSRSGTADGVETSDPGLAVADVERGDSPPSPVVPRRSNTLSPPGSIPPLRV